MKYSIIKIWRRHVNGTNSGMKALVEHENTCRFAVEAYCISLGLHFPSMIVLHIIYLKTSISLKDLDYRVTPLLGCFVAEGPLRRSTFERSAYSQT
jgi:hypothetical protein